MGLGGIAAPPPELGEAEAQAMHCWAFCAGWAPERWPVYAALYPVADWHSLVDLMREIRNG